MTEETIKLHPRIESHATERSYLGGKSMKDFPGLAGYLDNFAAGRLPTESSDFYANQGLTSSGVKLAAEKLVYTWKAIPRMKDYEITRLTKYGSQGFIYSLDAPEQIQKFNAYYTDCHGSCRCPPEVLKIWRE